jgi:hypothetical protein
MGIYGNYRAKHAAAGLRYLEQQKIIHRYKTSRYIANILVTLHSETF